MKDPLSMSPNRAFRVTDTVTFYFPPAIIRQTKGLFQNATGSVSLPAILPGCSIQTACPYTGPSYKNRRRTRGRRVTHWLARARCNLSGFGYPGVSLLAGLLLPELEYKFMGIWLWGSRINLPNCFVQRKEREVNNGRLMLRLRLEATLFKSSIGY